MCLTRCAAAYGAAHKTVGGDLGGQRDCVWLFLTTHVLVAAQLGSCGPPGGGLKLWGSLVVRPVRRAAEVYRTVLKQRHRKGRVPRLRTPAMWLDPRAAPLVSRVEAIPWEAEPGGLMEEGRAEP